MKARKGGDKKAGAASPDTDNREQYDEDTQAQTVPMKSWLRGMICGGKQLKAESVPADHKVMMCRI